MNGVAVARFFNLKGVGFLAGLLLLVRMTTAITHRPTVEPVKVTDGDLACTKVKSALRKVDALLFRNRKTSVRLDINRNIKSFPNQRFFLGITAGRESEEQRTNEEKEKPTNLALHKTPW